MSNYALVGDIGGTNVRLAICALDSGEIAEIRSYVGADYDSLDAAIVDYLALSRWTVKKACIAIASPLKGDWVTMLNHDWAFSIEQMKQKLGWERLEMINDFTAISMSVPVLTSEDVIQYGGKAPIPGAPIAVYGPGTGLGVAHLMPLNDRWISLSGEGGHVDFAANTAEEDTILQILRQEWSHVSVERVLSGPGLVNLYRALVKSKGRIPEDLQPNEVTERALSEKNSDCHHALSLFCIMMGRFGGNLALSMATFGGVYIAGGIIPRFLDFFEASGFRAAFEDKGRLKDYIRDVPVYLITHQNPGLLGAGAYLRQALGMSIG